MKTVVLSDVRTKRDVPGLIALSTLLVYPPSVCDGSFRFLFVSKDSQHKPKQQMPHLSKR